MVWHYNGGTVKSAIQTDLLAKAITDKQFNASDILGFSVHKENENIDEFLSQQSTPFQRRHGWHEASVRIRVPCATRTFSSEEDAPEFTINSIYHRRLVDVVKGFFIIIRSCYANTHDICRCLLRASLADVPYDSLPFTMEVRRGC